MIPFRAVRICALFSFAWFSMAFALAAQPKTPVTMEVHGLRKQAEILVDKWGVPHIYAASTDDAFFVQGFNAARDRLFQIDLWRRRGLGLLSEVLGKTYLEQDRATRLFLYRGDMDREWAAYGPDAKRIAANFVDGINAYVAWLATNPDRVPMEFRLLGYQPSKWDAADVVRIRSHGLTRNLSSEVARARMVCATGTDGLKYDQIRFGLQPKWDPAVPEGLDPCLPADLLRVFTLATQDVRLGKSGVEVALAAAPGEEREAIEGSNNWVVGPKKSATGRPILAGDPHRAYSTPSLRYIAHLSAPGMDLVGAGEPALPGISMGHNGTAAFGLTIFNIDQEDLYVYDLNPANAMEYRYKGAWEPMRVVRESVPVKGGAASVQELVFTRHGAVIYVDAAKHRAYAVRSGWFEPGMSPYFGSVAYMRARSFADFRTAMLHWGAPSENQVYADTKGNIGWIPGGLAPVRPNWDGLLPVPGDGRYEWAGFWSGDKLPSTYNPASGYITTSNEMNLPADYPYRERKLGFEWTNDSRHLRIDEVLRAQAKVSLDDSMRLQNDRTSIPARRLVALLGKLEASSGAEAAAAKALALLRGWNAVENPESGPAALMEVWMSRYLSSAFRTAVLPAKAAAVPAATDVAVLLDTLEHPGPTLSAADRDRLLVSTLARAYSEMERLQGPDPSAWQWGLLHKSLPHNALADAVDPNLRKKLQPGPFPVGGDAYTPNASSYRATDFQQTGGPSFRMVLDVGNWDNSMAVNYPGQSGDPDNAHYADLADMWRTGRYFPLLYTRAAVEKATELRIVLVPAK
jgi:penicillin amidase